MRTQKNQSRFIEMFGSLGSGTSHCLGDFFNMKAGKSISAEDISSKPKDGLYPCYGGNGIRGYVTSYTHEGDTVLIGRQGALCGNVQIARNIFYATEHAVVVTPKVQVNSVWLYYALSAMNLNQYARGVAQPGLAVGQLEKLHFNLPDIKLQNDFAQISQRSDKSKFNGFKSRFIEMFGDASIERRLGDVSAIVSGKTIDLAKENEGGPIAYLKVADMNLPENERVVSTSSRFVSEATARTSGIIPIGATIFPKNGAAALHNKKRITAVSTCVDMNTMAVYSSTDELLPEFLYAFLVSQDIASLALVGAIPQIRAKDVANLFIPLPIKGKQLEYIALVQQADKSKYLS